MSIVNGHALDDGINTTRPKASRRSPPCQTMFGWSFHASLAEGQVGVDICHPPHAGAASLGDSASYSRPAAHDGGPREGGEPARQDPVLVARSPSGRVYVFGGKRMRTLAPCGTSASGSNTVAVRG